MVFIFTNNKFLVPNNFCYKLLKGVSRRLAVAVYVLKMLSDHDVIMADCDADKVNSC